MGTIPQELESFKTQVGSVDGMKGKSTQIQESLNALNAACSRAGSGLDSFYNSSNKSSIIAKFTKITNIINKISASLGSDLNKMLSESDEIIKSVDELAKINKEIDALNEEINKLNTTISNERSKSEPSQSVISDTNSQISSKKSSVDEKEAEFTKLANEAMNKLKKLKAMDSDLAFVAEFTSNDYTAKLDQLSYGSFTHESFTSPTTGVKVDYYLYVPDYGEEVENLPIHMYLHGSGENNSGVLSCGLPALINSKQITPSGIVVCVQCHGSDFDKKNYQQALLELNNHIAETKNGDKNKISLSGHSWGAITGYKMLVDYPDYFSAFLPISGRPTSALGYTTTKVWGFHGAHDSAVAYDSGRKAIEDLTRAGADATLYTYEKEGHGRVQDYTFQREFQYKDGEMYNPLEWAFQQEKA